MPNIKTYKPVTATFFLFIVTIISLHIFFTYFYIQDLRVGLPPDELAHISKIANVNKLSIIPKPTSEYLCTISGESTDRPSYLSHPPLYYFLNSLLSDKEDCKIVFDYEKFRFASLTLSVLALATLIIGLRLITSKESGLAIYLLFITSIPIFPYISAATNNDTLALFAFVILIISLLLLLNNLFIKSSIILISISLTLCLLTKATTGLQGIILTIVTLLIFYKQVLKVLLLHYRLLLFAAAILTIPISYYILVKLNFGTFLPSTVSIAENYWQSNPATLDLFQYLIYYLELTFKTSIGIASHESLYKSNIIHAYGLITFTLISFSQILIKPNNSELIGIWKFFLAGVVTFFIFTLIHFIFVYGKYRTFGYLGGIQFRYHLSLIPVIGLGYLLWHIQTNKPLKLLSAVLIIPSLLWSNFFYYIDNRVVNVEPKIKVQTRAKINGYATVTYKDNNLVINGFKYNCSANSNASIISFYNGRVYSIHDVSSENKSFDLSIPIPLNCQQYTKLLNKINIIQFCADKAQQELTLNNVYQCDK